MSRRARARRAWIGAAAVAILGVGPGCAHLPAGGRTGRPLDADRAAALERGTTTKAELFERLGAPMAIVGRGEYAEVVAAAVARPIPPGTWFVRQGGGTWPLQGDAALALFADRHALGDDHRVYYWSFTEDSGLGVLWVVFVTETYRTRSAELWVLVDEATERVVDAVFRTDR